MDCSTLGFRVPCRLLEFAQVHIHWIGDAIQPSHSLSPLFSALSLSQHQGLFQCVSSLHQVTKVVELQHQSFQVFIIDSPLDWLVWSPCCPGDSHKSLLQHHNLKASICWCSAFFMVQLWHLYRTTGKIIALTIWTFVGKVMSLFFNTLSWCVIAFLPRSKHFLISWLQSPSTVILDVTASTFSPICHEVMEPDSVILV